MKILIAVDGSEYTKRMLAYIGAHDELLGPSHEYTAITAVPPIPARAAAFLSHEAIEGYHREQAAEVLEPVKAYAAQHRWNLKPLFVAGHAGDAIAAEARSGRYDLVVMGSHGHSSVVNAVLGSVATRVLAACQVPVLLVR